MGDHEPRPGILSSTRLHIIKATWRTLSIGQFTKTRTHLPELISVEFARPGDFMDLRHLFNKSRKIDFHDLLYFFSPVDVSK
jgi:hypothetical protein